MEYCHLLASRRARQGRGAEEPARSLGQDGIHRYRAGLARSGIAKLRRAQQATQAPR